MDDLLLESKLSHHADRSPSPLHPPYQPLINQEPIHKKPIRVVRVKKPIAPTILPAASPLDAPDEIVMPTIAKRDYEQQLRMLNIKVSQLEEERELARRNFQNEIQFHQRQQYSLILNVQALLAAKQYQRLQQYIEGQLHSFIKCCDLNLNDDEETEEGLTLSKDTSTKSIPHNQGLELSLLIDRLKKNLDQMGMEQTNIQILPQLHKLANQNSISVKSLTKVFERAPFEMEDQQYCSILAGKIINQFRIKNGKGVVELIDRNLRSYKRLEP